MVNKKNQNNRQIKACFPPALMDRFFEIHVKGHLDDSWSDWLEGLEVKLLDNGEMILCGYIGDQAALMGDPEQTVWAEPDFALGERSRAKEIMSNMQPVRRYQKWKTQDSSIPI